MPPLAVYRIVIPLLLPPATDLVYDPSHPDFPSTAQIHLPPEAVDLLRLTEAGQIVLREVEIPAPSPARPGLHLIA